jgi:hypothetical protein
MAGRDKPGLEARIAAELNAAEQALAEDNPGRARVCARRAAGLAIRAWYQRRESPAWSGDAMTQLVRLRADTDVPGPIRQAAVRLTTKVDEEHKLPFEDDPVQDAERIVAFVGEAAGGG